MTNPFIPAAPAPQQQPAAPANPYAQQQPAAPPNTYTQQNPYAQPQQQNPYAQQAAPQPQYTQQPQQMPGNGLVARPGQFLAPPPPSASGSGNLPSIGDLQGRLLIIMPESVRRNVPSKFAGQNGAAQTQDQMTCTIIVLADGGVNSLQFMPKQNGQPTGQMQTVQLPYVIKGKWITQRKLVEQLEEALAMRLRGEAGLVFGRLWKAGTGNNDPYVLATPQPHEVEVYNQYVTQTNPFAV